MFRKRSIALVVWMLVLGASALFPSQAAGASAAAQEGAAASTEPPAVRLYPRPQLASAEQGSFELQGKSIFIPEDAGAKVTAIARGLERYLKNHVGLQSQVRRTGRAPAKLLVLALAGTVPDWMRLTKGMDPAKALVPTELAMGWDPFKFNWVERVTLPIPAEVLGQSYALRIDNKAALLVARGARGLSHGAVALMQLAGNEKNAAAKRLPALSILDWPDVPWRAAHVMHYARSWGSEELAREGAVLGVFTRLPTLIYCLDTSVFRLEWHPEMFGATKGMEKEEYAAWMDFVRACGIEPVPNLNMSNNIAVRFGYPYTMLDDDDPVYVWATEEIFDEILEVFRPRHFHLGMNEEWKEYGRFGIMGRRTKEEWRDAVVQFTEHFRRRGVSTMVWSDYTYGGPLGDHHYPGWDIPGFTTWQLPRPAERGIDDMIAEGRAGYPPSNPGFYKGRPSTGSFGFEKGVDPELEEDLEELRERYLAFGKTLPSELIMMLWPNTGRPKYTMTKYEATTGLRVVLHARNIIRGGDGTPSVRALLAAHREYPNAIGSVATQFPGGHWCSLPASRLPALLKDVAGPFWNVNKDPLPPGSRAHEYDECDKQDYGIEDFVPPQEVDLQEPMGWEALLDAEPAASIPQALKRLKDHRWQVWLEAREQLVASGLPAADELLEAMSRAEGEYRQRIEGCISRNARDARHAKRRGVLDVVAAAAFLRDAGKDVRDIAAEVIASASGREGRTILLSALKDPTSSAACARALGLVKETTAVANLSAALGERSLPTEARAEAARALGRLRAKKAAGGLLRALKEDPVVEVKREAAWALALVGHREGEGEIAQLLQSPDRTTRWRACIALVVLRSPELKKVAPWLASDDENSVKLAVWTLMPWKVMNMGDFNSSIRDYRRDIWDTNMVITPAERSKLFAEAASRQKNNKLSRWLEGLAKADPAPAGSKSSRTR